MKPNVWVPIRGQAPADEREQDEREHRYEVLVELAGGYERRITRILSETESP